MTKTQKQQELDDAIAEQISKLSLFDQLRLTQQQKELQAITELFKQSTDDKSIDTGF